jgi:alpha-tubulin suppressor-like RCC1 family protein
MRRILHGEYHIDTTFPSKPNFVKNIKYTCDFIDENKLLINCKDGTFYICKKIDKPIDSIITKAEAIKGYKYIYADIRKMILGYHKRNPHIKLSDVELVNKIVKYMFDHFDEISKKYDQIFNYINLYDDDEIEIFISTVGSGYITNTFVYGKLL